MKLSNKQLVKLLPVYSKLANADLEEEYFEAGFSVAIDAVKIEDALKPYNKIQEKLQKEIQKTEKDSPEFQSVIEKVNKEFEVALDKEVEMDEFYKISKDFIVKNKIKLTGLEIKLLKDVKALD